MKLFAKIEHVTHIGSKALTRWSGVVAETPRGSGAEGRTRGECFEGKVGQGASVLRGR